MHSPGISPPIISLLSHKTHISHCVHEVKSASYCATLLVVSYGTMNRDPLDDNAGIPHYKDSEVSS